MQLIAWWVGKGVDVRFDTGPGKRVHFACRSSGSVVPYATVGGHIMSIILILCRDNRQFIKVLCRDNMPSMWIIMWIR